jgi:chromosome segregation ATPase
MIEKDIKNYKGRLRINLTKKDNEEINSTKVYLFSPEEHSEVEALLKEFEKLEKNKEEVEKLKSENNDLQQYKVKYEKLQEDFNTLTKEGDSLKIQLKEKSKELEDITTKYDDLKEKHSKLSDDIDTKDEEFKLINKELHQVKNKLIVTQDNNKLETDYLRDIISDYESRGLGKRIRNKNPKSYILEPNYKLIESKDNEEEV